jgi:hypothetical protein
MMTWNNRLVAVVAFLAVLITASPAFSKSKSETFDAPFADVWKAALAVVAEEFTLGSVSREDGMISFQSGTLDASALVVQVSESVTSVTVNTMVARAGFSGIGPGSKIKNKLLAGLAEKLRQRSASQRPAGDTQGTAAHGEGLSH